MKKILQTITAYKYQIIDIEEKEAKIIGDGKSGTVNFEQLLLQFLQFLEVAAGSKYYEKVLSVDSYNIKKNGEIAEKRIDCQTLSGYYGKSSTIYNLTEDSKKLKLGIDDAVMMPYNVFFYINTNEDKNICIFHRYGKGGCKTIFLEKLNEFLKEYYLRIDMHPLVSEEYKTLLMGGNATKFRLIKNTVKVCNSTDIADQITPQKTIANNVEMELSFNLKNKNIWEKAKNGFKDLFSGSKTVKEVFEFIPEEYEFDEMKMEVKIGRQTKQFDFNNFGKLVCEYDITEKLVYDIEGHPTYDSISSEADIYAQKFVI